MGKFKVNKAAINEDGSLLLYAERGDTSEADYSAFHGCIKSKKFRIILKKSDDSCVFHGHVMSYDTTFKYERETFFSSHNEDSVESLCYEWIRVHYPKSHIEVLKKY